MNKSNTIATKGPYNGSALIEHIAALEEKKMLARLAL